MLDERFPGLSTASPLIAWLGSEGAEEAQFVVSWIDEEPGMYRGIGPSDDIGDHFGGLPFGSQAPGPGLSARPPLNKTDAKLKEIIENLAEEGISEKRIEGVIEKELKASKADEDLEAAKALNPDGSIRPGRLI